MISKLESKVCDLCGMIFEKKLSVSRKMWGKARFCSRVCSSNHPESIAKRQEARAIALREGSINVWNKGTTGLQIAWNKGKGEYARKLGFGKWMKGRKGEISVAWKGEKVGYGALHDWVRREKGSPVKCEHCGKTTKVPQGMHWANVSGEYHRDLTDWIRLCAKCHKKYDKGRKQFKYIRKY